MRTRDSNEKIAGAGAASPMSLTGLLAASLVLASVAAPVWAVDWSDTALSYRTGSSYREPFISQKIRKDIINLTYVNGYQYGSNLLVVDYLMSDDDDPRSPGSGSGATETYVVYRHTLDIGKIRGDAIKFGPVRGVGLSLGFDWNSKNDAGYNSRKHMLVAGPTLMMDVPGFLNISLLALWESNKPYNEYSSTGVSRYRYDTHPMLNIAWGIPLGTGGFSFEGFANFITSKGKDEYGAGTRAETNIDMQVMYDASSLFSARKNAFKVGLEYQYWKNKFGLDHSGPAGSGAFAKTPQLRIEYHF